MDPSRPTEQTHSPPDGPEEPANSEDDGGGDRPELENPHPGELHFALDEGEGRLSRWNTLRAMRVLDWSEGVNDA